MSIRYPASCRLAAGRGPFGGLSTVAAPSAPAVSGRSCAPAAVPLRT